MQYKEKIISILRQQIEPCWDEMKERRERLGAPQITLEEQLEILFNQRVNCGGYALEIDVCVFPSANGDFERTVSGIIDEFNFVRLLGDSELGQDEYIVVYRMNELGSHHFIKIRDCLVSEKNEASCIQNFSNWPVSLLSAKQAVFAIKKEHDVILRDGDGKQRHSVILDDVMGRDFEETVENAILTGNSNFNYRGHNYSMRREENHIRSAVVISEDTVIAEVMIDGNECVVEVKEEEKDYVSNTKSNNPQFLKAMASFEDKII